MRHYKIYLFMFIIAVIGNSFSRAQVISRFNWDSNPVKESQYGPNATSVSGSAASSPNGVGGTNGLNAGFPKSDINLVLPSAGFMNIGGVDFSIDFQRDETRGDFISCGTSFSFGIDGGELFVKFEVDDNAGGTQLIEVYNIYAVPDDDIFRSYRFYYLPNTGYAEILVDGVVLWDYYIGNPSNLIWPNEDVIIGSLMDGNGLDKTIFDNMVIAEVYDSALPIEISQFEVESLDHKVEVTWKTDSELNNDYFIVENSRDGKNFQPIAEIKGNGTTNEQHAYSCVDENPKNGISYYRLKQVDFNGKINVSEVLSVNFKSKEEVLIFPNLLEAQSTLEMRLPIKGNKVYVRTLNEQGKTVLTNEFYNTNHLKMNAPSFSGTYMVQVIIDGVEFPVQKIVVL